MAVKTQKDKIAKAREYLRGSGISRDDSDDELGTEDHPWEWLYEESTHDDRSTGPEKSTPRKRKASALQDSAVQKRIVGAKMGNFQCKLGDTVLLKADGNEAWVGIICAFFQDEEDEEKMAKFMWFSTSSEIRNKEKRRTDALQNELYITPSYDDNPLSSINGKAEVLSYDTLMARFPTGKVPRSWPKYGKVFVCRRGCNTRTATYTEEFRWEDVYSGARDLQPLIDLVQSQTKATRKKSSTLKPSALKPTKADLDMFVVAGDEDDSVPKTPKKRRKLDSLPGTPSSKRKDLTPRKLITPSHKRIIVKKPLEFTPLGTRFLSPSSNLSSPFQIARSNLHVSSVPGTLPCRENEFSTVYTALESAITLGTGACLYISGTPGTGKTATVREVVAQLQASVAAEELDDFVFVEINGMKVTDPHQSYSLLWEALRGDRVSPSHALDLLEREFSHPNPRRVPVVVLMDELDQLVTKNQSVMYNFFNWPGLRHSRLIVLAVANTMDLPERTLSNKISSRLGLTRITFPGYTHAQLIKIIESRLENVRGSIVDPDAVQFASRKVAAVSGDARRALDICRRAVEIAEQDAEEDVAPGTPSKSAARAKDGAVVVRRGPDQRKGRVTIATIKQAINEATSSPLQQYLRALPLSCKMFLAALLGRVRRTGITEAVLGDVVEEAKRIGQMSQLLPVHDFLMCEAGTEGGSSKISGSGGGSSTKLPRMLAMGHAAMELCEAGVVGLEARRGDRTGKIRLCVSEEDVRLALRDDEEGRGLGFAA